MTNPNADVIKGYEFSATLQLRTPLRVLQHHGEIQEWSENGLPKYAQFAWEGIWLPVTKTWEELAGTNAKLLSVNFPDERAFDDLFRKKLIEHGFSRDEAAKALLNGIASDIGPVPPDGGTYLTFLKEFRGVVESSASPNEKRQAVEALSKKHSDYARYTSIHRARSHDWPDEWLGYKEQLRIPRLGTRTARRLYDAGFQSREALKKASDTELAAVKGVGKATILQIRDALP